MIEIKNIIGKVMNIIVMPKEKITYFISHIFKEKTIEKQNTSNDTVIIGTLRNPRQLGVCIRHKFYHIPCFITNENISDIGYVAIYQSRNFFNRMAGIMYYGKIKKIRKVPRSKIKEIPRDSEELYYRFEVEKWLVLDKKIEPKDAGIICEYTTLDKLKNAQTVNELITKKSM